MIKSEGIQLLEVINNKGFPVLKLNEEGLRTLKKSSSDTNISQTIALLGNTHAGKTTMLNELTGRKEPVGKPTSKPTTENINLYETPDNEFTSLRYLDCEGFSQASEYSQTVTNVDALFAQRRADFMEKTIPKLVYPISDIIVYVCNGVASRSHFDRISEFMVEKAVENVDQWIPPALILVFNMCDLCCSLDIEKTTNDFFSAQDKDQTLLSWYHTVRCINIPDKTLVPASTDHFGYSLEDSIPFEGIQNPKAAYVEQIEALKKEIHQILQSITERKKQLSFGYSSSDWISLFQFVVRTKDNLSIAHILVSLFNRDDDQKKVFEEYNVWWNILKYEEGAFFLVSQLAVIKYAWLIYLREPNQKSLLFKLAKSQDEADSVKKKLDQMFSSLFKNLWELIPCEATLKHNATKGKIAKCFKTKRGHQGKHCTRVKFYGAIGKELDKKEASIWVKYRKDFFSFFHIGYDGQWDGQHTTKQNPEDFKKKLLDLFHSALNYFCDNKPPEYFMKVLYFRTILFHFPKAKKHEESKNRCLICLNLTDKKGFVTQKCGHNYFCEQCMKDYSEIKNELWSKVSIDFFKSVLILRNICPLCDLKKKNKTRIVIPGFNSTCYVGRPNATIFRVYEEKIEFINASDQEQAVKIILPDPSSNYQCDVSNTELILSKNTRASVLFKFMGKKPGETISCIVEFQFKGNARILYTFILECQDIPVKDVNPILIEKIKNPDQKDIIHRSFRSCILHIDKFAVKVFENNYKLDSKQSEEIENEMSILSKLHHKNVDKLIYFHADPPALVTKFRPEGNLHAFVKANQLNDNQIKQIFRDIVAGMVYLHNLQIMHRDLKPENCLIKKANPIRVIVADFGESKVHLKSNMFNTLYKGTPVFMAPEVITSEKYDLSIDVYSFAMTMYVVISKNVPFFNFKGSTNDLFQVIISGNRPDISGEIFNSYRDVIQRCWNGDGKKRPKFNNLEKEFSKK